MLFVSDNVPGPRETSFPNLMKLPVLSLLIALLAATVSVSCSSDPNRQKLKYLKSGEAYFKAAKYQEAIIEFRNAVEIDPRFAAAHYQLGRTYLALKNPASAFRETNEAVTLDPANSDAQ